MKKHLLKLSAVLVAVGLVAGASFNTQAVIYTDTHSPNFQFLTPLGASSYSDTFDILQFGYDPATSTVDFATATFTFQGAGAGTQPVSVLLDGNSFVSSGTFAGTLTLGDTVVGSVLLGLSNTGLLDYTVNASGASAFRLTTAELVAQTSTVVTPPPVNAVPDAGATVGLLGLALVGLAGLSRKMRA